MSNCLAIITARGGSKRIPRKNIKNFIDRPIIRYSIDAALSAHCFEEVMVSTDDTEIAALASSFGAKVPFMRSSAAADDFSTTSDVIFEVLNEYSKQGREFTYCCCIYPTAPFITGKKLDAAYSKLLETGGDSIIPVVRFSFPILRALKIENGLLRMNWPEHLNSRSQDLPPAFHDCGQFYFFKTGAFIQSGKLFMDMTIPMEVQESEVQDIDTEEDWKLAELKYSLFKNSAPKF